MATNDYLSLIYQNPYVPYANNGFQRDRWCNAIVSMSGSTKGLKVFVFADTPNLATQYATQLSQYIQNNPIDNDQISTGLAFPVYDDASQGYMVRIEVLAGALHIMDTAKVIDRGQFSKECFDDCFWTTQDCKTFLDNGFSFAFTSAFSGDFNTRTNPSKNDCSC